jgi:hypothetical protein
MARDLAKSSFRTHRTRRRALRVDRFGPERTQRNEVLSRKTGRQAKFCWTSGQNFLGAPRHATKFIVLRLSLQQIIAFSLTGSVRCGRNRPRNLPAGSLGKLNSRCQDPSRPGIRRGDAVTVRRNMVETKALKEGSPDFCSRDRNLDSCAMQDMSTSTNLIEN